MCYNLFMNTRPFCEVKDCQSLVKIKKHCGYGRIYYRKLCHKHYQLKYQTPYKKKCSLCDKEFQTYDNRQKFCSRSCASLLKGRGKLRLKDLKASCEICKISIKETLVIHHLIGKNRGRRENGNPRMILCSNCHLILHSIIGVIFNIVSKEETIKKIKEFYRDRGWTIKE